MAEQKIILTEAEKDKLEAERRNLIDVVRPEVIEALALARSQGDLSENADYDAARDRQAQVEARIAEISELLASDEVASDYMKVQKLSLESEELANSNVSYYEEWEILYGELEG